MTSDSAIDSRIQVLLIDDDAHLRQALSQTLDLAGLKVLSLGDAQGLAARIPAGWPGVVVSDIRMPGIDGLQLLQQLRERDAELPVLLITGHGDVPLAVQAMRAGAYDFWKNLSPTMTCSTAYAARWSCAAWCWTTAACAWHSTTASNCPAAWWVSHRRCNACANRSVRSPASPPMC